MSSRAVVGWARLGRTKRVITELSVVVIVSQPVSSSDTTSILTVTTLFRPVGVLHQPGTISHHYLMERVGISLLVMS